MAMIKCSECKQEISSGAKSCPHCGKRRTSSITKIIMWFFIIMGVVTIWAGFTGEETKQINAQKEAARVAALTPEQKAAEEAEREKESILSSARGSCLIVLKESLNDPDSADIGSTRSWYTEQRKDGTVLVQPTARAKNAFGAYVHGTWDCVVKPEGKTVRILSLKQIRP